MESQNNPLLQSWLAKLRLGALFVGIAGAIAAIVGAFLDPVRFLQSYLFAYLFWVGMSLGCLALAMLHQLAGGKWGARIIRILEAGMSTLPIMFLLFIPIAIGVYYLYPWADPTRLTQDPIFEHESAYLNAPFFLLRAVVYLIAWIALAHLLRRLATEEDRAPSPELTGRLQYTSGLGLIVFGLTASFAVIDWVMSLEPHWYSTIFPAMVLMGAVLGAFAFAIVVISVLDLRRSLEHALTPGLFNDLGSLLLAFVMLSAYLGFSQFLLIYSGNLAFETPWYVHRLQGGWEWVALVVAGLEFGLPFLFLLFRDVKRNVRWLMPVALVLVLARLADMYWLVRPSFSPSRLAFSWLDLVTPTAIGGFWLGFFAWQLAKRPLLPARDRATVDPITSEGARLQ